MKVRIKLPMETRTIEHVSMIEIMPDEDAPDKRYVVVDNDFADDGGIVIVITEKED